MLKVGITGGIGSGKSTVCEYFSILGIPIYNSDLRAKILMATDNEIIAGLKNTFGTDCYLANNAINKAKLSKLVFENKEARSIINSIVHPVVKRDFQNWCATQTQSPYCIQESALLLETDFWTMMDAIIVAHCSIEERTIRIQKRDGCTKAEAIIKINSQISDEERLKRSTFAVDTSAHSLMSEEIISIHKQLIQKSYENK